MTTDLSSCTAIVTGGAKGYGRGITEVLREKGANVWITGRDAQALEETAQELGAHAFPADVRDPDAWERLAAEVTQATGRLDILINNAGWGVRIAPVVELTPEEIQACVGVNLLGAIYGCRVAARIMKEQKSGTIINVNSVCCREAWPGFGIYSAAKAGLEMLSKCLYTELREYKVRVTSFIPSWGATGFGAAVNLPPQAPELVAQCIQPRELGELIATVCELPPHLEIQDLTLWPLIQEVVPL